jgi:16S rRNA U1498 N3-methylase RsmE
MRIGIILKRGRRIFNHPMLLMGFAAAFNQPKCRFFCHTTKTLLLASTSSSSSSSSYSTFPDDRIIDDTRHLPRLYIDSSSALPFPPVTSSSSSSSSSYEGNNNNIENNNNNIVPLRIHALVPLTADQEHYLLSVMRIKNSKRWGRGRKKDSMNTNDNFKDNTDSVDYTGCVRIFNGADGEWLAKVIDDSVSDDGGGKKKRMQQQRRKRRGDGDEEAGAVLECIEQLLPQQSAAKSDIYNVQLYIGHLKNKQRRKWVFEKATELAVDGICILDTDYTNQDQSSHYYWEDDRDKHRAHVIEAAEQCERLTIPSISSELWPMEQLVDAIISSSSSNNNDNNSHHNHYWLVCRERSESSPPILSVLQGIFDCTNNNKNRDSTVETSTIHILIGPEGGWVSKKMNMHLK